MKSFFTKFVASIIFAVILCGFFYFGVTKADSPLNPSASSGTTLAPSGPLSQTTISDSPSSASSTTNRGNFYDLLLNPAKYIANLTLDVTFSLFEKILDLILTIVSFVLVAAAFLFDTAVKFSLFQLSGLFASSSTVINNLWALIRDTANIFFIFMLLYIAIGTIIGNAGMKSKTTLTNVIISALFINFSMFIARLLIDFGNIVATALYNQIAGGGGGISGIIKENLHLDQLFSASHFTATATSHANLIMGLIMSIILIGVMAYVYFYAAFIFIGRAAMLILLVITSPIGFVGNTIPGLNEEAREWRKNLTNQILVAPIFLLFMLMITKITSSNILQASISAANGGGLVNIAGLFYYIIVIKLLFIALKKTKDLSGEVGALVNKTVSGVTGLALATATGGTSVALQQTIGRGAAAIAESDRLKSAAASGGITGTASRLALKATVGLSKGSINIRNAPGFESGLGLLKEGGVELGKYTKGSTGGFVASREAYTKAQKEFAKENLRREISDEDAVKELREKTVKISADISDLQKKKVQAQTDFEGEIVATKREKIGQQISAYEKQIIEKENSNKASGDLLSKAAEINPDGTKTQQALEAIKKIGEQQRKAYQEEFAKTEEKATVTGMGGMGIITGIPTTGMSTAFELASKAAEKVGVNTLLKGIGSMTEKTSGTIGKIVETAEKKTINLGIGAAIETAGKIGSEVISGGLKSTKATGYGKAAAAAIRKEIKTKTDEELLAELAKKVAKKEAEKEAEGKKEEEKKPEEKAEVKP